MASEERPFGPYLLGLEDPDHLVVRRADGEPAEPGWYEMWVMTRMAWGAQAMVIEIFPPALRLVDGQNQRHFWRVPEHFAADLPCLNTGRRWESC